MILTTHSSLSVVADAYYEYCLSKGDKPSNIHLEMNIRNHIKPYWKSTSISSIQKPDVLTFREALKASGLSVRTIYGIMNILNHIFIFAMQNHLILINPCSEVKTPYGSISMPEHKFSDEEVTRLKLAFPKCSIPKIFFTALYSGLPLGELAALRKSDISYDTCEISISRYMTIRKSRNCIVDCKRPRTIPLPLSSFQQIAAASEDSDDSDDYVFINKNNTSYAFVTADNINSALGIIRIESGIPDVKRQSFQDNFIIRCLDAGVDFVSLENYYGYPVGSCISRAYYFRTHPQSL